MPRPVITSPHRNKRTHVPLAEARSPGVVRVALSIAHILSHHRWARENRMPDRRFHFAPSLESCALGAGRERHMCSQAGKKVACLRSMTSAGDPMRAAYAPTGLPSLCRTTMVDDLAGLLGSGHWLVGCWILMKKVVKSGV